MRSTLLALTLLLATPALAQGYPYPDREVSPRYDTDGQSVESIDVFFEPLARYGRWVDSRYGRAWSPNVARDWRPYTIGHWEEGAYGQTWRSDEPFGWAVYHFGRWGFDQAVGWVWVPDTVWGPAWVAFRDSDDVTGWAPLPPRVTIGFGVGYGGFNDWDYDRWYQPSWVYVPRGLLYGRTLRNAYLPYARNRDYWNGTRGVTRYDRVGGRVVNRSFDRTRPGFGDGRRDDRRDFPRDQRGFNRDGNRDGNRDFARDGNRDVPRDSNRDFNRGDRAGVPVQGGSSGFEQSRRDRGDPRRADAVPPTVPPVAIDAGRGRGGQDFTRGREPGRERGNEDRGSRPNFDRAGRGDGVRAAPPVQTVAPTAARPPAPVAAPPPRAERPQPPQREQRQPQQRERSADERPQ